MDLEIIIQPLIEKIEQSLLWKREKDKGVELLTEVLKNAKQKPRSYELEKLLPPIHTVEDIIDTVTARKMLPGQKLSSINNWVPFKFSKQLHKQYKCLSELNKSHSSADDAEVQSKTSRKVDNYGVLEKESSSDTIHLKKKSLSDSKDTVVLSKKPSATIRAPPTFSEDNQVFTSGNKDVGRNSSVLKDLDEGQHQSRAKTSCHREEWSVPIVLEHLVSKLAQPVLNVRTRQLLILKTNLTSPGIAIFLWSAYNSYHTKQHFKCCSWVHVSRESGEGNILSGILKQVTDFRQEQGWSDHLLKKRLHDFLVFKRYLIVLFGTLTDDVWHNLKSAFPYSLNGSRVILLLTNIPGDWSQQQPEKFSDYLQEESTIFGMKDIMNELSQSIFNPYRMLFLISVVGVAESEKTTLLWAMYNAKDVKQLFQCHAWVHVSEKFKEKDLLAEILKQVTDNEQEEELDLEPLRLRLCNFLAQNRYLIVLYDVWSADVWDKLKLSLPNLMNGSRVILTVHEADVAQQTNSWIFGTVCGKDLLRKKVCNPKVKHGWGRLSDIMAKESGIVGLDDKVKELAELVLNSHLLHFLISVVGVAGSGKTTLVKAIYNSLAIKQHFDCRAFVSVSQVFEIRKLLADLSMQLGMVQKDENWSEEELRQRLQIYLAWKRYLIVLDDFHTADVWSKLSRTFSGPSNGSKVILMIRDAHVARRINPPARVLQLRLLNDVESWDLFVKKVPRVEGNAELITLKDKILQRCGGLPFDIVVLGGLLSTKELDIRAWSVIIEQVDKKERKKRVPDKSLDQPTSSYTKQENETKKMLHALASQDDTKNPIADQPNSLAQHASADTKLEEKDGIGEIEQAGRSEAQQNFSVQQSLSDKKQEEEVKHVATNEDRESSSNQSALSDTKKREEGKTLETRNTYSDQDQSDSSDETLSGILALGYQDLDTDLKFCLNYLGLFPRSYKVPFRRFFQLLVAEGLVKQATEESTENGQKIESSGSFEERVKEHIGKLEQRSMIEVEKGKLDGRPKTICLQSTVYDALSPRAVKVGFFHIHRGQDTSNTLKFVRRFAEHTEINDDSLQNFSFGLRSYISFKPEMGDLPASGVDKLLKEIVKGGFGLIVILDLERVYKPVLSKHLSKLPNLKYLGLRWTFLDSIPDSVGDLPCLQTLDMKHTNISTLPGTFWKATNLQHLFMDNICFDTCISKAHQTNGSLTSLQTLLGLVIRNKNSVAYLKEAKMHGLRKLGVKCYGESIEVIDGWISKLRELQSLKLRSINKSSQPSPPKLGDFRHLEKLSQLYFFGKLPEAFDFRTFPSKLEILTLSVSELSRDPMEELKMLDNLKILRLHARSYMGKTMTCRPDIFPQLRILKLWMLVELEEWKVEEGAMLALEEVEIRCCMKLNKPSGLEKLTTLKELVLTSMKENFVKEVKKSMGSNVTITVHNWKFSSSWE